MRLILALTSHLNMKTGRRVWCREEFQLDPNTDHCVPKLVSSLHSPILTPMFHFLSRSISPKLVFSQNHTWVSLRLISNTSKSKGHSFAASYLIDTCGYSPRQAASVSKRIHFETREKPDSVIEFFKNQGFSQTQLLNVIGTIPAFLASDPEKAFQPKIEFFKSKGFSNSDIPNIITGCPDILRRSLHKEIIPCFDFFNNMFQSKDKIMKAIIRHSGILFDLGKYSAPNIKLLREEGVPESLIIRFIEYFPRSLKQTPKRFKDMVEEVKELEFNPSRLQFVVAVNVKICISRSAWARNEGLYKRWGWTDDDIRAAFRVQPRCMATSGNKIEAVMDFLVNKLSYESSAIARCPVVLTLSLEKRIIPRGSVILALLSKGLVNKLYLSAIFLCVERVFLSKYVFSHEKEADELLKLYKAKLALAR